MKLRQKLNIPIMATNTGGQHRHLRRSSTSAPPTAWRIVPWKKQAWLHVQRRTPGAAFTWYGVHHGGDSLDDMAQLLSLCPSQHDLFKVLLPHGARAYRILDGIEVGRDGLARCTAHAGVGALIDSI